ncbi:MAG: hypothetical protein MUC45_11185 [Actinomycetia bacterium]|nr:hypothetical protein [Actinomycetes bacterium]
MTVTRILAAVGRLALLTVLALAAVNTLLSLYRWEWQRALIAAVFFVAALVVLATMLVLRRLAGMEARLAELTTSVEPAGTAGPARHAEEPFAWLRPPPGSTAVFLPLLLGFGALLSLFALLVERVVAFTVGGGGPAAVARPRSRRSRVWVAVWTGLLCLGLVLFLPDVTEDLITRDEEARPGQRAYVLQVRARRDVADPVGSAVSLLTYCRVRVNEPSFEIRSVTLLPEGTVRAVVSPLLGPFKARSFEGCLRDLVLDRRQVQVLSVDPPAGDVQSNVSTVAPS